MGGMPWGQWGVDAGRSLLESMGGSMWNSLWGGITSGNWGGTSKERKNQIHDIRTLRRREYQDMVYSLQQAGLNPVLAVGATPGHSSGQQIQQYYPQSGGPSSAGISSARAAHRSAGVKEDLAPPTIDNIKTNTGNAMLSRAGILQQYDINQATIDRIRQDTRTQGALQQVHEQDAINKGASAREIEQRMQQIDKFGLPGQTWEGILRQMISEPGKGGGSFSGWDLMRRIFGTTPEWDAKHGKD